MHRLFLLAVLFILWPATMPPTAAQTGGPFRVIVSSPDLSARSVLAYEIDDALAHQLGVALAEGVQGLGAQPRSGERDVLEHIFLSGLGYAVGGALGYGVGYLTNPGSDQLFSAPGAIGLVVVGSIGSALGAHLAASPPGRVDFTVAGTLLAQGIVIALATLPYDESSFVIGPAIVASPFVAIGTSVGLERIFGGR